MVRMHVLTDCDQLSFKTYFKNICWENINKYRQAVHLIVIALNGSWEISYFQKDVILSMYPTDNTH